MKKTIVVLLMLFAASLLALQGYAVLAESPDHSNAGGREFGALWYNGYQVRTFVPNGKPLTHEGTDPLFAFPNHEQDSIIQYAPGDPEYRGGHWAVSLVTWTGIPYLIDSYEDLVVAEAAGHVTILREPSADVLCPVMP